MNTQRSYRTPKGTELPLMNLRGKEYLEVKYRLVWFREDHPDWAIETELLSVNPESAYARAMIKDEHGRVIATSHKFESRKGFPDFIEKAETGSIGRALALIGYGTQFCAEELDEGSRIVDAPAERVGQAHAQHASAHSSAVTQSTSRPTPAVQSISPVARVATPPTANGSSGQNVSDPGEYRISFGKKYKGMQLKSIPNDELEGYVAWLEDTANKKGVPLSDEVRYLKNAVSRYLDLVGETSR